MNKVTSLFTPKKLVIWICIILLIFTLPTINQEAQSETQAIVTMLCIDKDEENVKAVVSVLSPGQDKQANYQVFSGTGDTLASAVDGIALAIGKDMGFAQCEIMAIGENITEDNIMKILDYMTRTKKVGKNAILTYFEGDILDFAKSITALSMEKSLKLDKIINFDKQYILADDSNIESFYKGFFSELSLGIMPKISLTNTETGNAIEVSSGGGSNGASSSGQSSSSSKSGGESSSSSTGRNGKYLVTDGSIVVFKNGKKYCELSPEEVRNVNIFTNSSKKGRIVVDHITDEVYNDAKVVVNIVEKDIKIKVGFDGDTPVFTANTEYTIFIDEVIQDEPTKKFLVRNQDFFTENLIEKLKEKVLENMDSAVNLCKEQKIDLLNCYENFYRKKYKQWTNYLDKVGLENYLDNVRYEFNVKIHNEY